MKNITAQYRDLLEGKISKANFMTNVRRLFPDYIGATNSLEDAVTILKGKRILSEGIHDRDITSSYGMAGHVNPKSNDDAYARMVSLPIVRDMAKNMSDYDFQKLLQDFGYEEFWSGDVNATIESLPVDVLRDLTRDYGKPGSMKENVQQVPGEEESEWDKVAKEWDPEFKSWPAEEEELESMPIFYLVDERGEVVDQVEAPDAIAARNHFENEYEGLMTSMTVVSDHPQAMYEAVGEKNFTYKDKDGKDKFVTADNIDQAKEKITKFGADPETVKEKTATLPIAPKALNEAYRALNDNLIIVKNCINLGKSNPSKWRDLASAALEIQQEYSSTKDESSLDEAVENLLDEYNPPKSVIPYETTKGILREAEDKSEGSYKKVTGKEQYAIFNEIDRVNPYEFKKGITIEMGMQYLPTPNYFTTHFNPEALAKATKKVLKNLQKDPAYYTNNISLEFEKKSGLLQKPKELKVGADGEAKVKGFTDAKSNTETNLGKKEKGTKSPEGVKEMKPSKKSMGSIKIMKSNEKLPKGVELMKEDFKPGVNLGTAFDKFKQDIIGNKEDFELADENAFEDLVKKYDWYAEMSDDSRKWDAQQVVDRKLKDLGKKIGVQRAVELFNQYAPKDRKVTASFFSVREDKIAKLKEYLKAEVRKILKEEDPALTKLEKDEENAEKALATVLTKKAAILNKPGTQG